MVDENVPAAQSVQVNKYALLNLPETHNRQEVDPEEEYAPSRQREQLLAPLNSE